MKNTLIIPSAGNPQNLLFPGVYDLMVPINGKPVVNYIIDNALNNGIKKLVILLNENDNKTEEYIKFYSKNLRIKIITKKVKTKTLGETIFQAKNFVEKNEQILIQLGDTLYVGNYNFNDNFVFVSNKKVLNPRKWTFVDESFNFYDKCLEVLNSKLKLVIGIYFLKEKEEFFDLLEQNNFNLYLALEKYFKNFKGKLVEIKKGYYDLGHLDEYYKSKIDFLRTRNFNSLEYDDFRGIITKKSKNRKKLLREINWFKNIPQDLKIFTPRLTDYKLGEEVSYSLEFYGYSSLADIFLYSNLPQNYLENILEKLLDYVRYVKKNYNNLTFGISNFYDIYLNKTFSRLKQLRENKILNEMFEKEKVIINGKEYENIKNFLSKNRLLKMINGFIYKREDITVLHGDLNFSNILFDIYNGLFKLIDPRGKFGEEGIWGDIKYDLAKLRHSIHGRYENIIADLFVLEEKKGEYNFQYLNYNENLIEFFDKKLIDLGYNVEVIKFIEALLFLTMIPLHSDSIKRQKMMYLTSVILFNETKELGK